MEGREPVTVEEMYGYGSLSPSGIDAALDRSRNPRSADSLYETFGAQGVGPDHVILDIGARDAAHTLELVSRFGCRAVAVDPVERNRAEAKKKLAAHESGSRVEVREGAIERIPATDDEFDAIFSRDMFGHVADAASAFVECRRVLRPGGSMVVYDTFATELMEPAEAARIYRDLATVPERMSAAGFEQEASAAGFAVADIEVIGSQWREAWEEDGSGRTSRQLLHAARMIRCADDLRAELGERDYRVELANALWGIYQMIGKLEPRVYVLRVDPGG